MTERGGLVSLSIQGRFMGASTLASLLAGGHAPDHRSGTDIGPGSERLSTASWGYAHLMSYPARLFAAVAVLAVTLSARAALDIRRSGREWATIEDDGTVRVDGRAVGLVRPEGDVRIAGRVVGEVESDGTIRRDGRPVGCVQIDGALRQHGREIGAIEDDGTIRRDGREWGRGVRNCCGDFGSKRMVAVVLTFFSEEFVGRKPR